MEEKTAYLGLIQNTITRMASNSFLIKGWSVTLISALFVLAAKDANTSYVLVAYFPAVMFWVLDAFFLHQERLFRALYNDASLPDSSVRVFSMDTTPYRNQVGCWVSVAISKTLVIFHGCIIGVILFTMFVLILHKN